MSARSLTAVVLGGLVDIAMTNLVMFPVMVGAVITNDLTALPSDQVVPALIRVMGASPTLQILGWALGLVATVSGGYVAALIARQRELLFGALSAWLCVSLGVLSLIKGDHSVALWQHLLAFVLAPAFGAVGGLLRQRQLDGRSDGLTPVSAVP